MDGVIERNFLNKAKTCLKCWQYSENDLKANKSKTWFSQE